VTLLAMSAAAPAAAAGSPSVLRSGQQLVAFTSGDELDSPNGEYRLVVGAGSFVLDQSAPMTDANGATTWAITDVWMRDTDQPIYHADHSVLRLTVNGVLVLKRANGTAIWSDGVVAGAGSTLSLTSSGDLVVRDSSGTVRWTSRTTAIYLAPGRTLASGRRFYDRWDDRMHPPAVSTLTMGRDGNLVKRCNDHIIWRSGTYSPGAHLSMERSGDLTIRSTSGHIVWHTGTVHAGPLALFDTRSMQVRQDTSSGFPARWTAYIPADAGC
jgi:hypothetical protein